VQYHAISQNEAFFKLKTAIDFLEIAVQFPEWNIFQDSQPLKMAYEWELDVFLKYSIK
jgi:hypothetical protein